MTRRFIIPLSIVIVVGLCAGSWYMGSRARKPSAAASSPAVQEFTHLNIALHGGQLVNPAETYIVKQGTGLEFDITSDVFGKVQAPTNPAQTISFTQSPLVFRMPAPQPGTYPIKFLANGSKDIIQIGTVIVRNNNQ